MKRICLSIVLGLAAFAVLGVAPAAAVQFETCMKGLEECKPTTPGSTFTAGKGTLVVEGPKGEEKDECSISSKGEISDPVSEEKGDEMTFSITSVEISKCSSGELTATELPWTVKTDEPSFEENEEFMNVARMTFVSWLGCKYEESVSPDFMRIVLINNNPDYILWSGMMVKSPNQSGCWILRKVHILESILSIADNQLLGNNVCIK
jgi:hypothetical protein